MSPGLSIYLDLIRFLAALGVLFSHLYLEPFTNRIMWWRLGGYGDACVTIFFLLSGYVIAFVIASREKTAWSFCVSRFSRLYSVVVVGLLVTLAADAIGVSLAPDFYANEKVLAKPVSWLGYISSFFFVNEYQVFGFGGISPGTNGPFWSLSFEATYYAVAGFWVFLPWGVALLLSVLLLGFAGKTIIILFPIWLAGYALFHFRHQFAIRKSIALFVFLATAYLLLWMGNYLLYFSTDNFGLDLPWGKKPFNRIILIDYCVALVFALHLLAAHQLSEHFGVVLIRFQRPIRWLGALTFPLYCLHYPVLCLLAAISPWVADSWSNYCFVLGGIFLVVIVLTPVCEKIKDALRLRLVSLKAV